MSTDVDIKKDKKFGHTSIKEKVKASILTSFKNSGNDHEITHSNTLIEKSYNEIDDKYNKLDQSAKF